MAKVYMASVLRMRSATSTTGQKEWLSCPTTMSRCSISETSSSCPLPGMLEMCASACMASRWLAYTFSWGMLAPPGVAGPVGVAGRCSSRSTGSRQSADANAITASGVRKLSATMSLRPLCTTVGSRERRSRARGAMSGTPTWTSSFDFSARSGAWERAVKAASDSTMGGATGAGAAFFGGIAVPYWGGRRGGCTTPATPQGLASSFVSASA
mmetsp:Transcript_28241/g.47369  ORF Transcript_28241/g.47369 Transcript_28241/m.47369 type:complete len:212 (-) Transcript_28241:354-989(-)